MYEVSKSGQLPQGDYHDLKIRSTHSVLLMGKALGTTQLRPWSKLTVMGSVEGAALVSQGALLTVMGAVQFAHHTFLEGELRLSGAVNVPREAVRLLPAGHSIFVRPGTIFNCNDGQYLLTEAGTLRKLFGNNTITMSDRVWCRYDVVTNSFTQE